MSYTRSQSKFHDGFGMPEENLFNYALNEDVLILVFNCLSLIEQFNARQVCCQWRDELNYILRRRTSMGVKLDEDEDDDYVSSDCGLEKHVITRSDCIQSRCRTIKDGSRTLHVVPFKALTNIFSLCPSMSTISLKHTIFDFNNVWKFFSTSCPTNLQHIDFSESQGLIDEVLKFIAKSSGHSLQHVKLLDSDVSEEVLELLIQSSPLLESLDVSKNVRISGESFRHLPKGMKKLCINDCFYLRFPAIKALCSGDGVNITHLEIGEESMSESILEIICEHLKKLQVLVADLSGIHKLRYLRMIKTLPNLHELSLDLPFVKFDDILIEIMRSCSGLKKLCLDGAIVTDDSLKHIHVLCPLLESLSILKYEVVINKKITDISMDSIRQLSKLKNLDIESSYIGDGIIRVVQECQSLETINIDECKKVTNKLIDACIAVCLAKPTHNLTISAIHTHLTTHEYELPTNLVIET